MNDIRINYERADADRRMRLLEMAGGDLDKAMKLECWVRMGVTDPAELAAPVVRFTADNGFNVVQSTPEFLRGGLGS